MCLGELMQTTSVSIANSLLPAAHCGPAFGIIGGRSELPQRNLTEKNKQINKNNNNKEINNVHKDLHPAWHCDLLLAKLLTVNRH